MIWFGLKEQDSIIGGIPRRPISYSDEGIETVVDIADLIKEKRIPVEWIREIVIDNCLFGTPERKVTKIDLEAVKAYL